MSSSPAATRVARPGPTATDPVIAVRSLAKSYGLQDDAVRALDAIEFEIGEGEFVAIVGPSGCGKTTLLKILAGLLPASSGTALLRGKIGRASCRERV